MTRLGLADLAVKLEAMDSDQDDVADGFLDSVDVDELALGVLEDGDEGSRDGPEGQDSCASGMSGSGFSDDGEPPKASRPSRQRRGGGGTRTRRTRPKSPTQVSGIHPHALLHLPIFTLVSSQTTFPIVPF